MSSDESNDDFLSADEGTSDEEESVLDKKCELDSNKISEKHKENYSTVTIKDEDSNKDIQVKNTTSIVTTQMDDKDKLPVACNSSVENCPQEDACKESTKKVLNSKKLIDDNLNNSDTIPIQNTLNIDLKFEDTCMKNVISNATEINSDSTLNAKTDKKINENQSVDNKKVKDIDKSIIDIDVPKPVVEKAKQPKVSKIGLKKPRDSLGERLGNKKLGSRVTKPLIGISSDSIMKSNDDDSNKDVSPIVIQPGFHPEINMDEKIKDEKKEESTNDENLSNWGTWGDWGSSIASAASTLTKEVTKGVGTVLETVESGMGIPDAETMAKEAIEIENKIKELNLEDSSSSQINEDHYGQQQETAEPSYGFGFGGFSSLVSGVSGALESASNKVLLGGLDTLEKIGRKTMDVLQDGDPGLKRKRAFLNSRSSNLSSVLKDARQRALEEETHRNDDSDSSLSSFKQISMAQIWENTEGSAHCEALALIATRCQNKTYTTMQDLPALAVNRLKPLMHKIKICAEIQEENEVEDVNKELGMITRDIDLPLQFVKILKGWPDLQESLQRLSIQIQGFCSDDCQLNDIQRDLLEEVAQLVSNAVGLVHKAAEVSLVSQDLDCIITAQKFQKLIGCLSSGLEQSADTICESITRSLSSSESFVSSSVTNIYVQMSEANSLLQSALQHLTVVLTHVVVRQMASEFL